MKKLLILEKYYKRKVIPDNDTDMIHYPNLYVDTIAGKKVIDDDYDEVHIVAKTITYLYITIFLVNHIFPLRKKHIRLYFYRNIKDYYLKSVDVNHMLIKNL